MWSRYEAGQLLFQWLTQYGFTIGGNTQGSGHDLDLSQARAENSQYTAKSIFIKSKLSMCLYVRPLLCSKRRIKTWNQKLSQKFPILKSKYALNSITCRVSKVIFLADSTEQHKCPVFGVIHANRMLIDRKQLSIFNHKKQILIDFLLVCTGILQCVCSATFDD